MLFSVQICKCGGVKGGVFVHTVGLRGGIILFLDEHAGLVTGNLDVGKGSAHVDAVEILHVLDGDHGTLAVYIDVGALGYVPYRLAVHSGGSKTTGVQQRQQLGRADLAQHDLVEQLAAGFLGAETAGSVVGAAEADRSHIGKLPCVIGSLGFAAAQPAGAYIVLQVLVFCKVI